jgi:hypothetical protein
MVMADGTVISAGLVEFDNDGAGWHATLRRLDQSGNVASAYFGQGIREIVLRLQDGRRARARIAGTTFIVGGERVCHLDGLEPLV